MWGGLMGEPRRTNMGISYMDPDSPLYRPDWVITTAMAVFGGVMMFCSAGLYFLVLGKTLLGKKQKEGNVEFPEYAVYHNEPRVNILDDFRPWLVIMFVVIFLAYIPAFTDVFKLTGPEAPPYSPDNPTPLELYEPKE